MMSRMRSRLGLLDFAAFLVKRSGAGVLQFNWGVSKILIICSIDGIIPILLPSYIRGLQYAIQFLDLYESIDMISGMSFSWFHLKSTWLLKSRRRGTNTKMGKRTKILVKFAKTRKPKSWKNRWGNLYSENMWKSQNLTPWSPRNGHGRRRPNSCGNCFAMALEGGVLPGKCTC